MVEEVKERFALLGLIATSWLWVEGGKPPRVENRCAVLGCMGLNG